LAYHVAIAQFEGPLDLLVQLVEANQLEVTAISAAAVTEQFMAIVEQMGDDQLSEIGRYLDLAARLLVVKSLALLPKQDIEPEFEVVRLEAELELYRQNQHRARRLAQHLAQPQRSHGRPIQPSANQRSANLPSAAALEAAFRRMLDAQPAWENQTIPKLTLTQMLKRVQERLNADPLPLHDMVDAADGPSEVALLLVAVLELAKNNRAAVAQLEPFGHIMVSAHA
jgi:segregation and condensation protein A